MKYLYLIIGVFLILSCNSKTTKEKEEKIEKEVISFSDYTLNDTLSEYSLDFDSLTISFFYEKGMKTLVSQYVNEYNHSQFFTYREELLKPTNFDAIFPDSLDIGIERIWFTINKGKFENYDDWFEHTKSIGKEYYGKTKKTESSIIKSYPSIGGNKFYLEKELNYLESSRILIYQSLRILFLNYDITINTTFISDRESLLEQLKQLEMLTKSLKIEKKG